MNRAAAYQRMSADIADDEHGVKNQLKDQMRLAETRDYEVVLVRDDNDISALTGKHRPGYEAVMEAVKRGEIDVILVYQTSRFWRNRRERAEGIEILREAKVSIVATKGPSLDMSNAYDRMMAGLIGEFDTAEVEVKGERQKLAYAAAAKAGKRRAGTPRPFGWDRNHDRCTRQAHNCAWTVNPEEAAAIEAGCRLLLGGGTISGVMREWERLGVRPAHAPFGPLPEHPWTRRAIRVILTSPMLAGLPVYQGEVVALDEGAEAGWPPVVSVETWKAVKAVLDDPSRTPPRGVRTLLGGLALCPCGNTLEGTTNHKRGKVYRCAGPGRVRDFAEGHVQRAAGPCDEYVVRVVVERLSRPDAAGLLLKPETAGVDVADLRQEYTAITRNLDEMAADAAVGGYSKSMLAAAARRGHDRMAEIDGQLAAAAKTDVLAGLVGGPDVRAIWDQLDQSRQRAVIRTLMRVTLLSPGKGKHAFDDSTVEVEWLREV